MVFPNTTCLQFKSKIDDHLQFQLKYDIILFLLRYIPTQLIEYIPIEDPGAIPRCTNPDPMAVRASPHSAYVIHSYFPAIPWASIDRRPK